MGQKSLITLACLAGMLATLLTCSLAANYMLWTGKVIRPEWVQDYVSVLSQNPEPQSTKAH